MFFWIDLFSLIEWKTTFPDLTFSLTRPRVGIVLWFASSLLQKRWLTTNVEWSCYVIAGQWAAGQIKWWSIKSMCLGGRARLCCCWGEGGGGEEAGWPAGDLLLGHRQEPRQRRDDRSVQKDIFHCHHNDEHDLLLQLTPLLSADSERFHEMSTASESPPKTANISPLHEQIAIAWINRHCIFKHFSNSSKS